MWFEDNIKSLEERNPDLARRLKTAQPLPEAQILKAKSGDTVLRVGKVTLHSLYNPVDEGNRWASSHLPFIEEDSVVVVLGFGMGYHLKSLVQMTDRPIWVCEPGLDILRSALEEQDLASLFERVHVFVGREEDVFKSLRREKVCVLTHSPSKNMDPSFYDAIRGRLNLSELPSLNILVVPPIYGGSLPVARYCTMALRDLGHQVETLKFDGALALYHEIESSSKNPAHQNALKSQLMPLLSEMVLARCLDVKPDLVLVLAQAPLIPETLKKLKETGITLAYWFTEDFRLMGYWKEIAPFYDYFFVIQKGEFPDLLSSIGVPQSHYLPMAAIPEIHRPLNLNQEERKEYTCDIGFVGAGYYNRHQFFTGLLDLDFKIWGSEWDLTSPLKRVLQRNGDRISTEECVKIFNGVKINLNLHSSTYHRGVNPEGDFVNPRTYELAACGRFQLVDKRSLLGEHFDLAHEMRTFTGMEDLREKIRYFLDHPEEAQVMANAARKRVLSEHTYQARMEEMLGFMHKRGFRASLLFNGNGDSVEEIVQQAGPDTELGMYLSRFKGKKNITLDEIVQEIRGGDGRLSEPEAVFLLMNELVGNR